MKVDKAYAMIEGISLMRKHILDNSIKDIGKIDIDKLNAIVNLLNEVEIKS